VCLAIAAASAFLSARFRIPVVAAWSTPGAALLAALPAPIGIEAAVGAFVLAATLVVLTALVRPLGSLVARLPTAIAAAMLAGVLFRFVAGAAAAVPGELALLLPLIALFLVARQVAPMGSVLAALAAGVALAWATGRLGALEAPLEITTLVPVAPGFVPGVLLGVGLPLWIVTMASQNLPGLAVLRAAGYAPPVRPILAVTGLASLVTAAIGAHTTNLAAITASLCTGPEVHPDPARRWPAGVAYGGCYLLLALFAGTVVAAVAALPPALVTLVAGLALLAPLTGALGTAVQQPEHRFAATLTLAVSASGITLLGIGAAFWGLLVGLVVLGLDRLAAHLRRPG
jgi:benzoate membrane transport protein